MFWFLTAVLGVFLPRLVLFVCWLFGLFDNVPWGCCMFPLLGFIFLPYTTLTFGLAYSWGHGLSFGWLVLLIIAVLFDLGSFEGTRRHVKTLRQ